MMLLVWLLLLGGGLMPEFCYDIESDGLLDTITKVHCLAIKDCSSGAERLFVGDEVKDGLALLDTADKIYGHNVIGFDNPALKLILDWVPKAEVVDTMIWAMFLFSDLKNSDARQYVDDEDFDAIIGSNSLDAWGQRLGCRKLQYDLGWETYNKVMGDYCVGDTRTTEVLRRHLASQPHNLKEPLALEHRFAFLTQKMEQRGIKFDVAKATALYAQLQTDLTALCDDISKDIPPEIEIMKTPEYWIGTFPDGKSGHYLTKTIANDVRKALGYKPKDCKIEPGPLRTKTIPFNPNSRGQVRAYLHAKYGWVSPKLTDAGEKLLGTKPPEELAIEYGSVSEEILRDLPYPEGKKFADHFLMKKVAGFIQGSDEDKGWLNLARDGRIHHRMLTVGAVTMRCTHSRPNLSQAPGVLHDKDTGEILLGIKGRYGYECRELFSCDEGRIQVGADLSGIEARNLAHYLKPYDKGAYVKQVLEGDIHQLNVNAIKSHAKFTVGRGPSKGLFYCWCYGGGDQKIGTLVVPISVEAQNEYNERVRFYRRNSKSISQKTWSKALKVRRRATPEEAAYMDCGNRIRRSFEMGIDGLEDLLSALAAACKKGYIIIQDGRRIPVRSPHAALNCLLQSTAAVIMKRWVCYNDDLNVADGIDYHLMAVIHDEIQADIRLGHEDRYSENCMKAIKLTEQHYNWRCPLAGEAKRGKSWSECH